MNFVKEHLAVFRQSEPGQWQSTMKLGSWLKHVHFKPRQEIGSELLERSITRNDLAAIREGRPSIDTPDLCAYIFAWGGMKTNHGKVLFGSADKRWLDVADDLRKGLVDRFGAYERFNNLSIAGGMPGVGPAYFTKLLFFLPENDEKRGLIMDQWTGRSINLLTDSAIVKLTFDYYVDKFNSVDNYRRFLDAVVGLSMELYGDKSHSSLSQLELCLFSQGGKKNKHPWRRYVEDNKTRTPRH